MTLDNCTSGKKKAPAQTGASKVIYGQRKLYPNPRARNSWQQQAADPSARRSIYDGQERLGDIQQRGDDFVARDRSGKVLGAFDSVRDAIDAVGKAAAS
jgi:hypothetical protein